MTLPLLESLLQRLRSGQRTRIVAFGSSNTERRITGLHWFDWLDLGLVHTYGRVHHFINSGLSGDTTRGLAARFEEDVALYKPHAVLVTIGGNDSNPGSGIGAQEFEASLLRLADRIRELGALPVFQTYYAADVVALGEGHGSRFLQFMDIIRAAAERAGLPLVDHHRRWEPLRLQRPDLYQQLMLDALHVNALGNMLLGLDLVRAFGVELDPAHLAVCADGLRYQQMLDLLGG